LKDDYNKMVNIIYDSYEDSIELNHVGLDYEISFTTFVEDWIKLVYKEIYDEIVISESDAIKFKEEIGKINNEIIDSYKDFVGLSHLLLEHEVSFILPMEDWIKLKYKEFESEIKDSRIGRISLNYKCTDDLIESSNSDKIDLLDSISE